MFYAQVETKIIYKQIEIGRNINLIILVFAFRRLGFSLYNLCFRIRMRA